MKRTASLPALLSLVALAACGGGDDATTGDDAPEVDAMPQIDPDAAPDVPDAMPQVDPDAMPQVASGDSCATARVITETTTITGADFAADFADDHDFTDASCDDADPEGAAAEAVFEVQLTAGQTVTINEEGAMDAVLGVQTVCGDTGACLSASDVPDEVSYTAAGAESVFVFVGSYYTPPDDGAYSITFTYDECGDGVISDAEACDDDGHVDGDGCSATCTLELGYTCTDTAPTVCTAFPDLGSFGAGETITATSSTAVTSGDSVYYTVTFTEAVTLTGTLTATAGDPDLYAFVSRFEFVPDNYWYAQNEVGPETLGSLGDLYFTAGTYVLEINAYDADLTNGYALTMQTVAPPTTNVGTFDAAQTIADVVRGTDLPAGDNDYYTITFSAPVLLSGTLATPTAGDIDLYWWTDGNPQFVSSATGDETFTDEPLPAGTYHFFPSCYYDDADCDGFTMTLSTTAP